jgi:hypothetical protein
MVVKAFASFDKLQQGSEYQIPDEGLPLENIATYDDFLDQL